MFVVNQNLDSIQYINSHEDGQRLLKNTEIIIQNLPNDSIKARFNRRVACEYYNIGDLEKYHFLTLKNIEFSTQIKDTLSLGISFYDVGDYFYDKSINDSAFYFYNRALKTIPLVNKEKARAQFKIAKLYKNENQLIESEVHLMRTIEMANQLNDTRLLYECYNFLGIIQFELEYYDEAIQNYEIAKSFIDKIPKDPQFNLLLAENLNNIGRVYLEQNDLKNAYLSFESALKVKDLKKNHIILYTFISNNLAHIELIEGRLNSPNVFLQNLKIRDSLNSKIDVIMSYKLLGEYYLSKKDSSMALTYLKKACDIAHEIKSFGSQLDILKLKQLANPKKKQEYQEIYINVTDSIMFHERRTRNKFAKIEYETEQVIHEKKELSKKMNLLVRSSVFIFLVLVSIYLFYRHKVQKRLMILQSEQQKNNEETYQMILNQNEKINEIKNFEKNRIATELHDGVLSKMFGIRINIERLLLTSQVSNKDEAKVYIQKLTDLQSEIRQLSHDLIDDTSFKKESFNQLIEDYLNEFENDYSIHTILKNDSEIHWELCTIDQKFQVFRIIQESLTNVRKYAKATLVSVVFTKKEDALTFQIKDNGAGYSTKNQNKGIGFKNMQYRMKELNGKLEISSSRKGTVVYGEFTIKQ